MPSLPAAPTVDHIRSKGVVMAVIHVRALVAAALALAALSVSACSGDDGSTTSAADTTAPATSAPESTTTTEPAVEPVTGAERRWLLALRSYSKHVERIRMQGGVVTHLSRRREANAYADCKKTLRRAGDPGRLAPARRVAVRACARFNRAARFLGVAIASSSAGGVVEAGTADEKRFERALNGSIEAAGNGQLDLQRAIDKAQEITTRIEAEAA